MSEKRKRRVGRQAERADAAPRDGADGELARPDGTGPARPESDRGGAGRPEPGGTEAFGSPPKLPVDAERLREFDQLLERYKAGKARLEQRVVAAEQWWKLRSESEERRDGAGWDRGFRAKSGWLHNVIVSKHADAMENFPEPLILPREPGDAAQARMLTAVLPVILAQNRFESTYSDVAWQKLKTGTGVYKITWDAEKLGGLGDIGITRVDLLSLFWEPGITDIQKSRYLFHCELRDRDLLEERFPALRERPRGESHTLTRFVYDDSVGTEGKSLVVDVYYKKAAGPRSVLHYCQYVGDTVLYSTENEAALRAWAEGAEAPEPEGLYAHGRYPFVFDPLWPVEGSPCGYGYVDLCRNTQTQLDMLDTAFLRNALVGATPRYFERVDGSINEEEFRDLTSPIVHVAGSLDDTGIRAIDYRPLAGGYLRFYQNKVDELRETSGNTESANGIYSASVTAASAIASLQEASGKTSRDSSRASYRAFAELTDMVIELVRQFYDLPRTFRIRGEDGREDFALLDNSGIRPQELGVGSVAMGCRLPVFDIRVEVQKRNAYTRQSQNELAMQLFRLGFFEPGLAPSALSCLEMMDFEGREALIQRLRQSLAREERERMLAAGIGAEGMTGGPGGVAGGFDAGALPPSAPDTPDRRARERSARTTET